MNVPETPSGRKPGPPPSKRATVLVTVTAALFVVMPLLFWRSTWFGMELSDEEITRHLTDQEKPRNTQHALAQISERMARGDSSAEQWYPQITALSEHSLPELRLTAAWVMGQDPQAPTFRRALQNLLGDGDPMVRRNASLSLSAFGDAAARGELRRMLSDFTVLAGEEGEISNRLAVGDSVERGTLLGRVSVMGQQEPAEVRAPVPGTVKKRLLPDGSRVAAKDAVMVLSPHSDHVFQALRALYLVGSLEDIDLVRPFLRPREGFPEEIAEQARLTLDEVRRRAGQQSAAGGETAGLDQSLH